MLLVVLRPRVISLVAPASIVGAPKDAGGGGHDLHAREGRVVAKIVPKGKKLCEPPRINLRGRTAGRNALDPRAKQQRRSVVTIVQRTVAEAVGDQQRFSAAGVPDDCGEGAIEP